MYYSFIIISVILFGGCFALNDAYQRLRGNSLKISFQYSFVCSLASFVTLLAINGFRFEFTLFTLCMAVLSTLLGFGFTYCAFKALGIINLSLFSLFSMLGGMMLPFVQGIVFYSEAITIAKIVCFVFICIALLLTVEKGEKTKGGIYYAGIFILNGMSGVLAKIFTEAPFEKTSSTGYAMLGALSGVVLSGFVLVLFFRKKDDIPPMTWKSESVSALGGILNRISNLLLVIALAHVDASVQYPMVTGGVMIVSTLICFLGDKKPSRKEILSVALAFIGLLALFLIPV